ncbi:class I SAM-dependent methyltransferase [Brevundimonas sp. SL130]|uniref:class I SAM-dependent methyltransferase n=1 Tax=Brevundimonas sp. SL130 TaxID=2995143 RepID=UPI00226CAF55|nr:class I SAM-dependent methyltransferase [Brevundimonas sp. SL130]WAC61177.1 methyltransferase domain-containing protein [Brevundimonas sp. SL130]
MGQAGQIDEAQTWLAEAEQRLAEGDLHGAFAAYKACLKATPDFPPGLAGMGLFLAEYGDPGTAAQVLSEAVALGGETLALQVAPAFSRLLEGLKPRTWSATLGRDLQTCLSAPTVDPQSLSRVTAEALLLKQPVFDGGVETLEAMGRDPLWLAFLSRCVNVSAPMETRLNAVRAALVEALAGDGGEPTPALGALTAALAISGFASEYAAPVRAASGMAAVLFRPPTSSEASVLGEGDSQALLIRGAVEEPVRERALAKTVAALTPEGADAVSEAVRDQYEANPYPRWSAPPAPRPRPLAEAVTALPGLDRRAFGGKAESVLVAGCGTGFEPIDMARMDPSLAITAMDLSRASLAHGLRVAQDLGLSGVRFAQGDILALDQVQARFDVVTSTGVIHHMARPEAGLARLAGVLRPGGVVRLGLYSERARAVVRMAHDLIRARGWTPVEADIRAFRAHVLALPDGEPLATLKDSADFYSLSGCRDLVFHVQEHRYTPPQLGELIAGAGLRLVGFEASPEARAAFAGAFGRADPLDLGLWDQLEARRPDLFAGMYHLWAQKPG